MLKITDVVTNGINHWMVWKIAASHLCEFTDCPHAHKTRDEIYVVPVILNKDGSIQHICFDWRGEYWLNKTIDSIKPNWELYTPPKQND